MPCKLDIVCLKCRKKIEFARRLAKKVFHAKRKFPDKCKFSKHNRKVKSDMEIFTNILVQIYIEAKSCP